MREIKLTQGMYALVSDMDFARLNKFKWRLLWLPKTGKWYAIRSGPNGNIYMHDEIAKPPAGLEVHHRNTFGLDNQRRNLKKVTRSQHLQHRRLLSDNSSGYRGVSFFKNTRSWRAQIQKDHELVYLGSFKSPIDAALAYDRAARRLYGAFAQTNL